MSTNSIQQNIPSGWKTHIISDLCDSLDNRRIPITKSERISGGIPYYGATGVIDYVADYTFDEEILLIGEDGADWSPYANKAFVVKGKSWVNNHAHVLKCKNPSTHEYLEQYLNWKNLDVYTTGGTRKKLNKEVLMNIPVCLPESKNEQQKIAEILGTVDEDIAKTEVLIETTEKLKRGLMQRLFTRGIGHTKFKETKIGQIPEEWGVVSIRNSSIKLIDGDRGTNYPKQEDFSPEGFCLFLSAKNVSKNGFIFDEVSFISQDKDQALRKGKLERRDIILTSRGTVGNVAYYDEKIPFANIRINSGMLIVRHGEQFDPVFLYRYFSSPQMEAKYSSMGSGSAQPQLPVGSLEQVEVPLIPIKEQKEIADIISAVNEKILVNKKLKEKLTLLKKGLMQDLLSGKVRTNI